jgi:Zn-dependent peptidase ImmA (M78 family)
MPSRIKAPINPKILEWFITDYNISLEEVAKKVGVKPLQVQSWIEGSDFPTYKQSEELAYKVFKKPLAVLFLAEIPNILSIKKKFRSLPEYLFNATTYKTRLAINKADFYRTTLAELYKSNPSSSPIFRSIRISEAENIIDIANKIRAIIGINLTVQKQFKDKYKAFNYYRAQFEKNGIFSFQFQLEGNRAMCFLNEEFPVIVLNSSDSPYSKIFSMFHELTHILMENEDIYPEQEFPQYNNDPKEVFCNKIAAEILVPMNEFKELYASKASVLDETTIKLIAKDYCVSREVILRRFLELGITSSAIYEDYKIKWDSAFRQAESGGGDYYKNKVSSLGRTYINKVLYEFRNGVLSDQKMTSFLDIKYGQLQRIEAEIYS